MSTKEEIDAIRAALSPARMGTYEAAACIVAADDPRAIELYTWNAHVSAALLSPTSTNPGQLKHTANGYTATSNRSENSETASPTTNQSSDAISRATFKRSTN